MANTSVKYPNVEVQLTGCDGNAFYIIGKVMRALQKAKVSQEEINQFKTEAMSVDYDNVLVTCMKWVDVA